MLSVVATSRNDDHGGNALWRTQHFVNGLYEQATRHKLSIELILVDWNPPSDKPSLFDALIWPEKKSPFFSCRVIEVPHDHHMGYPVADRLPLFQYIAKNVGIRRAKGEYILATNIDILFSDALMHYLKNSLKKRCLFRVDRYDIEPNIPEKATFDEILEYAQTNVKRINAATGTFSPYVYKNLSKRRISAMLSLFLTIFSKKIYRCLSSFSMSLPLQGEKTPQKKERKKGRLLFYYNSIKDTFYFFMNPQKAMHTNACGDFTLLSREDWDSLNGYPEWPQYSWHIDSILLFQARTNGIKIINLPPECAIYHIEHGAGSGWTPEYASTLFGRLKKNSIPFMDDKELREEIGHMYWQKKKGVDILYNDKKWGAPSFTFQERRIDPA